MTIFEDEILPTLSRVDALIVAESCIHMPQIDLQTEPPNEAEIISILSSKTVQNGIKCVLVPAGSKIHYY